MCGGGGGSNNDQAMKDAEKRHQENMALQKEQMEEQKRQFEVSREDNQVRYIEQKKKAEAAPPPAPEKTAGVSAPTFQFTRKGSGRDAFRTSKRNKTAGDKATQSSAHSAKSLYIPK
tara:strand:- start:157 stop:507 length:351 start_codon:yes stop_codon:yes gene_type:complete